MYEGISDGHNLEDLTMNITHPRTVWSKSHSEDENPEVLNEFSVGTLLRVEPLLRIPQQGFGDVVQGWRRACLAF